MVLRLWRNETIDGDERKAQTLYSRLYEQSVTLTVWLNLTAGFNRQPDYPLESQFKNIQIEL